MHTILTFVILLIYSIDPSHPLNTGLWGLKGDAFVFGFPTVQETLQVSQNAVPLSTTESMATVFSGTNLPYDIWNKNYGVDSPAPAWTLDNKILTTHVAGQVDTVTGQPIWEPTYSSIDPVFITSDMFDIQAAATRSISHKIFMHFSHTLHEYGSITPYWGVGFEAEIGSENFQCCCLVRRRCCSPKDLRDCNRKALCKERCKVCSLSQCGIWLKGGISF